MMMTRRCPAEEEQSHGTGKRRWTDKVKCKIVDAVTPRPRRAAKDAGPISDVDVEMKQRLQREFAEHQARRRRRGAAPLPSGGGGRPNGGNDGATFTEAVANLDAWPKKGILKARSKFAAPEPPTLVELLFPTGVLPRPPKSSGPENAPSVLMTTVIAAAEKRRQGGAGRPDGDGGATEAAVNLDARPKKGILKARSKFASPPPPPEESATSPTLVELLCPVGVLATPPKSFRSSGPENTPAFLMSVEKSQLGGAGGSSSSTRRVDREHVEQWSKAKENSVRRGRYLRDFCPFQKDDDEDGNVTKEALPAESDTSDEETLSDETDSSEEEVETGIPFDSPASEAEFVEAIFSRHELKDDFVDRYAFQRSRDPFMRQQSLQCRLESRMTRNVVTSASSAGDRQESRMTRNIVTPASSAGYRPESRRTRKVTFRDCDVRRTLSYGEEG